MSPGRLLALGPPSVPTGGEARYQPIVPGSPLKGPITFDVTHPP